VTFVAAQKPEETLLQYYLGGFHTVHLDFAVIHEPAHQMDNRLAGLKQVLEDVLEEAQEEAQGGACPLANTYGHLVVGRTVVDHIAVGRTVADRDVRDRTVAGHTVAGHTVAGHTVAGHTAVGHIVVGHTVVGRTVAGRAVVDRTVVDCNMDSVLESVETTRLTDAENNHVPAPDTDGPDMAL
jgi:hypothetical protein